MSAVAPSRASKAGLTSTTERTDDQELVGRFAAAVSHEFANLLNTLGGIAHLLAAGADDPAAVRLHAGRLTELAGRGAVLVDRVARVGRRAPAAAAARGAGALDFCDLVRQMAAESREAWQQHGGSNELVLRHSSDGCLVVRGDAGELTAAARELVTNALDALGEVEGGLLRLGSYRDDDQAVFEVGDSGPGMTASVLARAVEPYFTTRGRSGRGLGLAGVTAVMHRHGGTLELHSSPGAGAVARLRLPVQPGPSAESPVILRDEPRAQRVLVVEDEPAGRELLQTLLVAAGHDVRLAGTVAEALEELEHASATLDLVLTDLGLPDGSGWDLVARLRERWPALRVGIVSAWDYDAREAPDPHVTPDFVIRKPYRIEDLLAHVGRA